MSDELIVLETLDDIMIPKSQEIVIPEPREMYPDEDSFLVHCAGPSPDDPDDRVRRFMGTLETPDARGDQIMLKGWRFKRFKKNPTVLWNHRLNGEMEDVLGRVTRIKREKVRKGGEELEGWVFDVWFMPGKDENPALHDRGEMAKAMVDLKVLNACSVTFRPITSSWIEEESDFEEARYRKTKDKVRRHDTPGIRYHEKEMLEFSLCPVGMHGDSLQLAVSKGLLKLPDFIAKDIDEAAEKPKEEPPIEISTTASVPTGPAEPIEVPGQNRKALLDSIIAEARRNLARRLAEVPERPVSRAPSKTTAEMAPRRRRRATQTSPSAAQGKGDQSNAAIPGTRKRSVRLRVKYRNAHQQKRIFRIRKNKEA